MRRLQRPAIPDGEIVDGHTALCAQVVSQEAARLRAALETITHSHPNFVTRGGRSGPMARGEGGTPEMPLLDVVSISGLIVTPLCLNGRKQPEPRMRRSEKP